ncbi:MAG: glycerophosphodiester phosphodiesterase [Clostridiales bacterium]|nr:glycerophosphodiester phosphodiesterase [Clostridiales bacterium]
MEIFNSWLVKDYIAHRGLHNNEFPENSLGAFARAIDEGYAIELDVRQISDGTVVVFHDSSLARVTGKDGYTKNLTKAELCSYTLCGTEFCIPTLEQVLALVDGQVPILIEIKNEDKIGTLEKATYELLKNYKGEYAIQSFNPYTLEWFKKNAPNVWRGQLSSYFKGENLSFIKRFALKLMLLNKKVSCPHFISYDARNLPNNHVKRFKKLPLLAWTVRSQTEYLRVVKYCDNIIFENFEPKI